MHFHHLHFYVRDAAFWRDWFVGKFAFELSPEPSNSGERLRQGGIDLRLSDPGRSQVVADYLQYHPPGLVDIAIATEHFESDLDQAIAQGAVLTKAVSLGPDGQRQCQLQGWADLRHTLVEVSPEWVRQQLPMSASPWLQAIDHAVLNVPYGELDSVSAWYQRVFALESGQRFDISTAYSGLRSQVLIHPTGTLQLPINEPTGDNSQIQEFLRHNRGAGIQHVALRSDDAVGAIANFRQRGLELISVPQTYYEGLRHRSDCPMGDTSAASHQQLLLDWAKGGDKGLLMQTFTKPIFEEPTFFFEIIERGTYLEQGQLKSAQGFGEGNFQALFEAIERAQRSRGSLK